MLSLVFVLLFISSAFSVSLETSSSYAVWNTSTPNFRLYPKNLFGRIVWTEWVEVEFKTFSTRSVLCTLPSGSVNVGTGWTITETPSPDNVTTNQWKFSKSFGGAGVSFGFKAFNLNSTVSAYGEINYLIRAGEVKMTFNVSDWNFPLLSDCFLLYFEVRTSSQIADATTSASSEATYIGLDTNNFLFGLTSLNKAKKNGVVVLLDALLSLLSGLLSGLLGGNSATLFYKFPAFNTLEYDPDYSILLQKPPNCNLQNRCSSHGDCVYDNICQCKYGWRGTNCDIPVCPPCSTHGRCMIQQETATCECDPGWKGTDCSIADCAGEPDCSSHGSCVTNTTYPTCRCNQGWDGDSCQFPVCPGLPACSGHGRCSPLVSPPACMCESGWGEEDCSKPFLCTNETVCGKGTCNDSTGLCECVDGWTGTSCSIALCPGYNDQLQSPNCFAHGSCNIEIISNHTCNCLEGWTGEDCSELICPEDCSGHGICLSGSIPPACDCDRGWNGRDCSAEVVISPISPPKLDDQFSVQYSTPSITTVNWIVIVISVGGALVVIIVAFILVEIYRKKIRRAENKVLKRTTAQINLINSPSMDFSPTSSRLYSPTVSVSGWKAGGEV